jgi:type VI secretion system protein ImpF
VAEIASRERLQPSLLDRLTDNTPERLRESFEQQTLSGQQLRQAVLRDLAWLLNAVNLALEDELTETPLAARSTINYGLPGLTGLMHSSVKAGKLEAAIMQAIRAFEPRIKPDTLRVAMRPQDPDSPVPALRFEIEGELWAQPAPMQIFLETSIDLETRFAAVSDKRARS